MQAWLNNTLVKHIPFLVYTSSSVMLGKWNNLKFPLSIFQAMIGEGCAANCESYTSLLSTYGRNGLFETTYSLLDKWRILLFLNLISSPTQCLLNHLFISFESEKIQFPVIQFFVMVCFFIQALLWFCSAIQPDIFVLLYKLCCGCSVTTWYLCVVIQAFNSNKKIWPTLWNRSLHLLDPYQLMWFSIIYSVMVFLILTQFSVIQALLWMIMNNFVCYWGPKRTALGYIRQSTTEYIGLTAKC